MTANLTRASALSPQSASQDRYALQQVFANLHAASCPQSFNFHLHTNCSDGKLTPEQLIGQAFELQLEGLAITDHHSIQGFQRAQQWIEDWHWQHPKPISSPSPTLSREATQHAPQLWTGVEINARLLDTEVHILGYAFAPDHPALQPYLQSHPTVGALHEADRTIAAIQTAGGLAVLAHPARYRKPVDQLIPEAARLGINGVETYYAYNNPFPWQPSSDQTSQIRALAEAHGLFSTCGTDTHGRNILKRL